MAINNLLLHPCREVVFPYDLRWPERPSRPNMNIFFKDSFTHFNLKTDITEKTLIFMFLERFKEVENFTITKLPLGGSKTKNKNHYLYLLNLF